MTTEDLIADDAERNRPNAAHLERVSRDQETLRRALARDRRKTRGLVLNYFRRRYGASYKLRMKYAKYCSEHGKPANAYEAFLKTKGLPQRRNYLASAPPPLSLSTSYCRWCSFSHATEP